VAVDRQQANFESVGAGTTPTIAPATGGWSLGTGSIIALIVIGIILLSGIFFAFRRLT